MENIKLLGDWNNVPSVILPTQENGTAEFIAKSNLLKWGVMRPDAELVKTWKGDELVHQDLNKTIPSYSTSATTLVDAVALENDTYTANYDTYNYYILERMLTIPIYSISSKAKGRFEYHTASYLYEMVEIPANTFVTLVDSTKKYASRTVSFFGQGEIRSPYWSSGSAVSLYTAATYGTAQAVTAPTVSSGVITVTAPNVQIRGHTTYFTSTYYNALTDIRRQYVIELYRAPKNNLNLNGWGVFNQLLHIVADVNSNDHKLT